MTSMLLLHGVSYLLVLCRLLKSHKKVFLMLRNFPCGTSLIVGMARRRRHGIQRTCYRADNQFTSAQSTNLCTFKSARLLSPVFTCPVLRLLSLDNVDADRRAPTMWMRGAMIITPEQENPEELHSSDAYSSGAHPKHRT